MSSGAIVLLPFVAGVLVYADTLAYDFVWDDTIILFDKVRHYLSLFDVVREPAGLAGLRVYRPITFGSYWVDILVWGRTALGFHLTGVLLHGLNSALVAGAARGLGCGAWPAVLAGLVFAVHPIHSEAVSWIACRADLLATTGALVALIVALRDRARPRAAWLALLVLATLGAVGSKEVGVAVPLVLLVLEIVAGASGRPRWQRPAVGAAAVLLYVVMRPGDRVVGLGMDIFGLDGLMGVLGAFGFYVGQLVLPWGVTAYVPEAPHGPGVMLWALAGLTAGVGVLLAGEREGTLRRFGLAWCALTLGPPLLVAVAEMLQTKVSERYLYLPSVGLALVIGGELTRYQARLQQRTLQSGVAAVLCVLAAVTVMRNRIWYDGIALWSAVVAVEQRDALPFTNLGVALKQAGRVAEADAALTTALAKRGDSSNRRLALINLGHVRLQQRRGEEAIPLFEEANAIGPHAWALHGLGIGYRWRAHALAAAGDAGAAAATRADAERVLRDGLQINARNHKLHFVLAGVLYDQGRYGEAVEHYRQVVALAPNTEVAVTAAGAVEQLTRGQ